jgi:hypothetical protein
MKRIAEIFLAVLIAGCSPPTPSAPTVTVTPPAASVTISGVVTEGGRPIVGAQVDHGYGLGAWAITDANGAFQLRRYVGFYQPWLRASKDGYLQPCATPINGDAPANVQLVVRSAVGSAPMPSLNGYRTVSGVVLQTSMSFAQPAGGVWVDFEPDPSTDWPAAYTVTDASGRFSLCGLPLDTVRIAAANTNGYVASVSVPSGQTDVELTLP